MKIPSSLIALPLLVVLSACSTHYGVSSHHGHHHRSHISVSGHSHGNSGAVIGALVVGGIIGHMIAEADKDKQTQLREVEVDDVDEVVNGYEFDDGESEVKAEPVDGRWYQLGQDGKCYLMESQDGQSQVVSLVPPYACND